MNNFDSEKRVKEIFTMTSQINCTEIKELFYQSIEQGWLSTTEFCLEQGIDTSDKYWDTIKIDSSLVHSAVCHYYGFKKKTLLFLLKKGADINFLKDGITPLLYVILQANTWIGFYDSPLRPNRHKEQLEFLEICKCLVENGADLYVKDSSGQSILELSKKVDLLYEYVTMMQNEIKQITVDPCIGRNTIP